MNDLSRCFLLGAFLGLGLIAQANIIRVEIMSKESPCFEGRIFGSVGAGGLVGVGGAVDVGGAVGAYEKLKGRAYGELDPTGCQKCGWQRDHRCIV